MKQLNHARPDRPKLKSRVRNLVEFKGIRQLSRQKYTEHIRDLYDGPAGSVLAIASLLSLHEPLVGRMLRKGRFDVTRFSRILDIGSGAGQILGHLLRATDVSTEIVACDLSHQMLKRARNRIKSDRPDYVVGDMTRLPFADGSFDCVTCGWVIEHLSDPRPGLKEFQRVLVPNGRVFLLATEDTVSGFLTSHTWRCRTYNRQELQEACEEMGLPWHEQLWLSRVHRFFKLGGILVEAQKPVAADSVASNTVRTESDSVPVVSV
ncbi:MAG: class I SAM-dependent methyltransferase [Planctomycetaceae bacterium]|nr:class I SAM-dependent methyltransferase [Planctomycetaceae bacterium]